MASMGRTGQHAVVIGASIAGLCAARVLADFYDTVSVFDRDDLPEGPENRSAIPQDRHLHLLMARGALEFDTLFPGLLDDMVAAGVPVLANRPEAIHFGAAGHVLGLGRTLRDDFAAYVPSRPHLEWQLRRRVTAMDSVNITTGVAAVPQFDRDRQRVTGVRLDDREASVVDADLVVDATGRGARLPAWLDQWGFDRPREDTVDVGIGYATHQVRMSDAKIEETIPTVIVAGASRRRPRGLGMLRYEDGTWIVTTFGVAKAQPPQDFSGMCALADTMLPPRISTALRSAEPIGPPAFHAYPTSRWRRYDEMTRFPTGILPFGDAVVSFNPTFGQGMTMTSIQAANLRAVLNSGDPDIAGQLSRATAKTTYPVWTMNAIGDLILHRATGRQPWWYRPVGGLFDQFLGAAETEPVLAEWFLRRFSLLDSLWMVPSPKLVGRTVGHNLELWWAGRRRAQADGERSRSGSR
jgi:2-polyprenyl-6-methoxyphenol hydroxylase-like FAD-dependent oxidoreductase